MAVGFEVGPTGTRPDADNVYEQEPTEVKRRLPDVPPTPADLRYWAATTFAADDPAREPVSQVEGSSPDVSRAGEDSVKVDLWKGILDAFLHYTPSSVSGLRRHGPEFYTFVIEKNKNPILKSSSRR
jgi:hypothetical protein